jgi:hypothetical protein
MGTSHRLKTLARVAGVVLWVFLWIVCGITPPIGADSWMVWRRRTYCGARHYQCLTRLSASPRIGDKKSADGGGGR